MSDEQRNEEETEVEAHGNRFGGARYGANDEAGDEVEGHGHKAGANDEASDDDEVEGHAHRAG